MVSPVDTSVKWASNLTGGTSPVFNSVAGAVIALLDAFLINGWASAAVAITVSGGVATFATLAAHPFAVDSVILLSGAAGGVTNFGDLNGEQKVTSKTGLFGTFNCPTVGNGTVTGTINCAMAPQGSWIKVFSGTNLASYKSTDPAANGGGYYLDVDDTNATYAKVRGYEAMTAVGVGTNPFPTVAGAATYVWWKTSVAGTTAADYFIAADSRYLILVNKAGFTTLATAIGSCSHGFGDIVDTTRSGGDQFATHLGAETGTTIVGVSPSTLSAWGWGAWYPRAISYVAGVPSPVPHYGETGSLFSGCDSTYYGTLPNFTDGTVRLCRKFAQQPTSLNPRGHIPGFYHVANSLASDYYKMGYILNGTGTLAGKRFFTINDANGSITAASVNTNMGAAFIDIVGPWR